MVLAATMGVGIFALPYVVQQSGWLTSLIYFCLMTLIIIQVHAWYWRVLEHAEGQRLVGLVHRHGGRVLFLVAFFSIVIGLLLVLLAYLAMAGSFFSLLFPAQNPAIGVLVVWILGSLPLLVGVRRMMTLEFFGVVAMLSILLGLFCLALFERGSFPILPAVTKDFLLPFGPFLFALAGWTALEPTYDTEERKKLGDGFRGVAWGTVFSVFFYAVFIASMFLLATEITPDTASGLAAWPLWERSLLSFFGLLLIVKSFVIVAWEVHTALERDLSLGRVSFLVPMLVPITFFFLGFNSFLVAVSLAGGLFLSLQYLSIIFVAHRTLRFSKREKFLAGLISFVFLLAAIYEVFVFLLK